MQFSHVTFGPHNYEQMKSLANISRAPSPEERHKYVRKIRRRIYYLAERELEATCYSKSEPISDPRSLGLYAVEDIDRKAVITFVARRVFLGSTDYPFAHIEFRERRVAVNLGVDACQVNAIRLQQKLPVDIATTNNHDFVDLSGRSNGCIDRIDDFATIRFEV